MNPLPVALIALLGILSRLQGQAEPEKIQTLKAGELTLKVPADWEVVAEDTTLLTVVTPQDGATDTFRENLRIKATDAAAGATIDALFQASLRPIEKGEGPLKLVGKGSLVANGHKVLWLSMRPRQPKPGQEPLTLVQYGFVFGGKAYSFSAMAADAQTEKFKAAVEKILKAMEPMAAK
jgi:hypothetical protein